MSRPDQLPDDVSGSFSVPCGHSHSASADPIVHPRPRRQGSPPRLLRRHHDRGVLDRRHAAGRRHDVSLGGRQDRVLAPSLAGGTAVRPVDVGAYYRAPVGADARAVASLPDGLEMIAGDGEATTAQDAGTVRWSCGAAGPRRCPCAAGRRGLPCSSRSFSRPAGRRAPHRRRPPLAPGGAARPPTSGAAACPAAHPVLLPEVTRGALPSSRAARRAHAGVRSRDRGPRRGVLVAWDPGTPEGEVATCVRRNLSCDVP
jgi:hypothetical protein